MSRNVIGYLRWVQDLQNLPRCYLLSEAGVEGRECESGRNDLENTSRLDDCGEISAARTQLRPCDDQRYANSFKSLRASKLSLLLLRQIHCEAEPIALLYCIRIISLNSSCFSKDQVARREETCCRCLHYSTH